VIGVGGMGIVYQQAPFTFSRVVGDHFVVDRVVTARAALLGG
jgi:hypothetical protein